MAGSMTEFNLTDKEKNVLLDTAREAITSMLEKRRFACREFEPEVVNDKSPLFMRCGAFVTLRQAEGTSHKLRGCIGLMTSNMPLYETVKLMAVDAAFNDYRFLPLTKEEFSLCTIEISVLSPMKICTDIKKIQVGVHGIYLNCKGRSGVLLPQVPVEQGWNRDEYLDYINIKAGLPPKTHLSPEAKLYTFTAVVFSEDHGRDITGQS